MNVKLFAIVGATILLRSGWAQDPAGPVPLSQLNRTPWPHIGAPPANGAPPSRAGVWHHEAAAFAQAMESIKQSWTGIEPASASELKFQVQQYEDLVRTVSRSSGYGNVILADCLRRLSLTLMANYAMAHPSDNVTIEDLLKSKGPSLLDSAAMTTMLAEELELNPPNGSWHLSTDRRQVDLVFNTSGSTYRNAIGSILIRRAPTNSAMMGRRDVAALLARVIETEAVASVHLPGLIQFRKLGGLIEDLDPNDVRPYMRLMQHDLYKFQFPPLGITMLGEEYLSELAAAFGPNAKKPNAFTKRALE
jgi:hypothetical protein